MAHTGWRLLGLAFALHVCASPSSSIAAWTQLKGEGLIISTLSDYKADARFDALAGRAPSVEYRKLELSIYGVYGVTDALTLGAHPTLARLRTASFAGSGTQSKTGLSDIELFARQRLIAGDGWVVSAQGLIKLPGPHAIDRDPLISATSQDIEGLLLFGRSGRLFEREYFSSLEAGFRARSNGAAGQLRADAAFGVRLWPSWQWIAQSFSYISTGRRSNLDPGDFDLYKAQLSILHTLTRSVSIQAGGYTEYAGRNTGAGNALFVAIWSRF